MEQGPTLLQRQALGRLLKDLTNINPEEYGEYFWTAFYDSYPIANSNISAKEYYSIIENFPPQIKKWIIYNTIMMINDHQNILTLQKSLSILLYSKVVSCPAEYYFMQILCNCIIFFEDVGGRGSHLQVSCGKTDNYTLYFYNCNCDEIGFVDFLMPKNDDNTRDLRIVISLNLIKKRLGIPSIDKYIWSKVVEKLYSVICNEWIKQKCTQIVSNATIKPSYHTDTLPEYVCYDMKHLSYYDDSDKELL